MSGFTFHGKPSRVWFMPVGAETLDTDGGQLWYATEDGLGSVADVSKCFSSVSFETTPAPEIVHLISDGEAVTSCCGRTPFELPRTERISVDPKLCNCKTLPPSSVGSEWKP